MSSWLSLMHKTYAPQYEALRRVHLIPSDDDVQVDDGDEVNENVFKNLDSSVSEGGENFSAGEKQLIWCVWCRGYGHVTDIV